MPGIDRKKIESISASAGITLGTSTKLYIIFIDLCGSTDFKSYCFEKNIPDGIWIERQLIYLHRIISIIERFKGFVIKTIGDEVMGYFKETEDSSNVLKAATDAHSLFRDISRYDNEIWRLKSKISIDYGDVYDSSFDLLKKNIIDPIGLPVDRCARLNSESKENEVIFSSSFFSLLPSDLQMKYSKFKESKKLKGIGDSEFYRLQIK